MKNLILENKGVGNNGFNSLWKQLDDFIDKNWDTLFIGAIKLNAAIEGDYYAPERIQINNTRLHRSQLLKYADGHKYSDLEDPTAEQLRQTVQDIQTLLNAASENIAPPFVLKIIENK